MSRFRVPPAVSSPISLPLTVVLRVPCYPFGQGLCLKRPNRSRHRRECAVELGQCNVLAGFPVKWILAIIGRRLAPSLPSGRGDLPFRIGRLRNQALRMLDRFGQQTFDGVIHTGCVGETVRKLLHGFQRLPVSWFLAASLAASALLDCTMSWREARSLAQSLHIRGVFLTHQRGTGGRGHQVGRLKRIND